MDRRSETEALQGYMQTRMHVPHATTTAEPIKTPTAEAKLCNNCMTIPSPATEARGRTLGEARRAHATKVEAGPANRGAHSNALTMCAIQVAHFPTH